MIESASHLEEMLAYYTEKPEPAWDGFTDSTWRTFADIFEDFLEDARKLSQRWEVLNRAEREPIPSLKRALIHERDGGACTYCETSGHVLTVDHIIPRSAFQERHLSIADRSDNLVSACWPCNERKSNFYRARNKRPGVTPACWECLNPGPDPEEDPEGYDEWGERASVNRNHLVFCGRCGMGGSVPDVSWVL